MLKENTPDSGSTAPLNESDANLKLDPHPENASSFYHMQLMQAIDAWHKQCDDVSLQEELGNSLMKVPDERLRNWNNGERLIQMKRLAEGGNTT